MSGLERMIGFQRRQPRRRSQIEIARLDQADVRPLAVDGEPIPDLAQELDAEATDRDVYRRGELLSD